MFSIPRPPVLTSPRSYVFPFLILIVLLASCDGSDPREEEGALFVVRSCSHAGDPAGETFRVLIHDPEIIAEAERLIASGDRRIISGRLRRGDGGFNKPWSWHLDPDSLEFADLTMELCDGCPDFVEEELEYWIGTVGTYCPWMTEILERER